MLDLRILGSSSAGNCYLLFTANETLIIECGVRKKVIMQALNFDLRKVKACIVTHEHKDHSHSIQDLIKAGIDVYATAGTYKALGFESHHRLHTVRAQEQFQVGGFTILPFDVQHDANEPVGYLIYHEEIGKLLFITDTFYCKYKFPGLNHIMIECNYADEILEKNVEEGKIHKALRNRLIKSHFSLANVKEFMKANDLSQVEDILLIHLSSTNSDALLFRNVIQGLTGIPVTICK